MYSPELQSKIALWRQRAADGKMTVEEYREALEHLRQGRLLATTAPKASKAKKPAISGDDLLGELE